MEEKMKSNSNYFWVIVCDISDEESTQMIAIYVWGRAMPMGEEWRQIIKKEWRQLETRQACHEWMKIVIKYANWPFKVTTKRRRGGFSSLFFALHKKSPPSLSHQPVKKLLYMRLMDDKSTSWEFCVFIRLARRLFIFFVSTLSFWACVRCWLMALTGVLAGDDKKVSFSFCLLTSYFCCLDIRTKGKHKRMMIKLELTKKVLSVCRRHQHTIYSLNS